MLTDIAWPVDYAAANTVKLRQLIYLMDHQERWSAIYNFYKPRGQDAEQWAEACIAFIEAWVVTYDPRRTGSKKVPFKLFRKQKEFVYFIMSCLVDKEAGLVEKSRDIGASWLCCAIAVWLWRYVKGSSIGFGSLLQTKVDRVGDMDSLFEKIRFIIRNLPPLFIPVGYRERQHATFMKIRNPENGALIKGEGGDNIGRGGRSMIYFKDESAHYQRPELIEAALGDNTDVQIDISSVNGSANVFYHRRMSGEDWVYGKPSTPNRTRVFVFDWRDHPGKTQKWYDERKTKAEREGLLHIFAQEVDRDYAGSVDRIIIRPEWIKAAIDAHIKLGFPPGGEKIGGQDIADEGNDKHALAFREGLVLRDAEDWGGEAGEAAGHSIPKAIEFGIEEFYYDCIGVGAGFKTATNNMRALGAIPKGLRILPWNAAHSGENLIDPDEHVILGDDESPINREYYKNLKAQGWFRVRTRFWKTYRMVTKGEVYPLDELISLDSKMEKIHEICLQLAQAVHCYATDGKTMVNKKPEGSRSPNLADAIIQCYNPTRDISIFDVL
jgi:phage terminase large subunit